MSDRRTSIAIGVLTVVPAIAALLLNFVIGRAVQVPEALPEPSAAIADAGGVFDPTAGGFARGDFNAGRALSERQYLENIHGRNIFDLSKIGVEVDGDLRPGEEQPSDLNVKLLGTVVADPAAYSAAFILEDGKPSANAYGVTQRIMDAEIILIEEDRVKLRRGDGREEWLTIGDGTAKPGNDVAAAPATGEDVAQTGDNQFEVTRQMLEENLNDLEGLSRMGRALLHRGPDGDFDGYRLSAIRRGSLPDKLGIRNGDIVHSVNGMQLDSVQGAMQALQALQKENGLKFEVTRRGQPVTLNYSVR